MNKIAVFDLANKQERKMRCAEKNSSRRRRISWLFSVFLVTAITFMPSASEAMPYKQLVPHVAKQLRVSPRIAKSFIKYVRDFVFGAQNQFTKIASHKTSQDTKGYLIKQTINAYFKHPTISEVQVSSLSSERIRSYAVQTYLERLSRLALGRYDTVELFFDQNYLSMGAIQKFYENGKHIFEFKIDMWQMFKGCKHDRNICYQDYTKKAFHIVFIPAKGSWGMKIYAVTADQPVSSYLPDREPIWNDDIIFQ